MTPSSYGLWLPSCHGTQAVVALTQSWLLSGYGSMDCWAAAQTCLWTARVSSVGAGSVDLSSVGVSSVGLSSVGCSANVLEYGGLRCVEAPCALPTFGDSNYIGGHTFFGGGAHLLGTITT